MLPRTPKGYRRIKVGEVIPDNALFFSPFTKKCVAESSFGTSIAGKKITEYNYGYFFAKTKKPRYKNPRKVWKQPADVIFNSIFPVEEIEREDIDGYIAALIEAKYTESEFRKACAVMAKERADALGESHA